MKTMLLFAVPMILGNLLQQCYNVADTLIVVVSSVGRTGCGGIRIYPDDFSDLDPAGALYGKQRRFFDPVWAEGF